MTGGTEKCVHASLRIQSLNTSLIGRFLIAETSGTATNILGHVALVGLHPSAEDRQRQLGSCVAVAM